MSRRPTAATTGRRPVKPERGVLAEECGVEWKLTFNSVFVVVSTEELGHRRCLKIFVCLSFGVSWNLNLHSSPGVYVDAGGDRRRTRRRACTSAGCTDGVLRKARSAEVSSLASLKTNQTGKPSQEKKSTK
jgi:hypothetical protein